MPGKGNEERKKDLLTVAQTLQECQWVLDHYKLIQVSASLDATITCLQNHVEFRHSAPEDLLRFFGLDDLKQADDWWKKDSKT